MSEVDVAPVVGGVDLQGGRTGRVVDQVLFTESCFDRAAWETNHKARVTHATRIRIWERQVTYIRNFLLREINVTRKGAL